MVERIAAVVLCGGESRRMGRCKAALPFGSETLLARMVRLASRVARPVVVVAAVDQALPELADSVVVVRDGSKGKGPLQGLADGFSSLAADVEFAYATAVDAPFLAAGWIELLVERIEDGDLALPCAEGRRHPLSALYRVAPAAVAIRRMLDQEELRLGGIAERLSTRVVAVEELRTVDPALATLRNLNTPDAYERAVAELGFREGAERAPASERGRDGLRKIDDYF